MKKTQLKDLDDVSAIMEDFATEVGKMPEADLIDLAARLKPAAKAIKAIDDHVKDTIKLKLRGKEGTRLGTAFKAVLTLVSMPIFRAKLFKEDHPKLAEEYTEDTEQTRITFEVR